VTRPGVLVALLATAVVLLTGCDGGGTGSAGEPAARSSSSSPAASASPAVSCASASAGLLSAVQRYVAAYGAPLAGKGAAGSTAPNGNADLQNALKVAQSQLRAGSCNLARFRRQLSTGLGRVKARGPVARAVLLRLTASMTGTAVAAATTVTVRPNQDLEKTVATLGAGSTVRLVAGTYRLRRSLVLLEGVTLSGAGRDRTSVVSTSGGSALLVLTNGRVELRGLDLRHGGRLASNLLTGGPSSSVVLTRARLTQARKDRSGQGGNAVVMTANGSADTHRGTTLQVTTTDFSSNAAAGILLSGGHVASIRQSRFSDNGQCGVCFSGSSTGAVRSSTFTGNGVGVAVLDTARPALVADTFSGGLVGVQVSGHGAPLIRDVRISRVTRAAMIFGDRSTGRLSRAHCARVPYGLVVSPKALPYVGATNCTVARGR
jgi:Right handed beta helix region